MLQLHGLSRAFGGRPAITDVSFTVAPGRMTGFVGANGAGKTTTMRIVLGVLAADAGTVELDGVPLDAQRRRRFGYMPEERGLYPRMRVLEQLVYLARLHGLSTAAATRSAKALLERLGLEERARDEVQSLSLGNQQRAQIAAALVHDPDVLILDEPFSGLDPVAVTTVQTVLADRARAGVPVLFSSHQLDIVERLCDDLVVIANGSVRAAGRRVALQAEYGGSRYSIATDDDADWVAGVPGVASAEIDGAAAVFEADTDAAQAVLHRALAQGPVRSFGPVVPSLADIFREVVA